LLRAKAASRGPYQTSAVRAVRHHRKWPRDAFSQTAAAQQRRKRSKEPADSGLTLSCSLRTISTACANRTSRFHAGPSPTSRPVRYCKHPSLMEGSRDVQRRGTDAGECEKPLRSRDADCLRGPVQYRPARTPAAKWRQAYETGPPCARCRTTHCRGCGIREPSSNGSSGNTDAKPRGASRVPGPSTRFGDPERQHHRCLTPA